MGDETRGRGPRVASVVVNWNGWEDTVECTDSLLAQTYQSHYVIVVDNGSTDGSVEKIVKWAQMNRVSFGVGQAAVVDTDDVCNPDVKLWVIPVEQNLGFSGGNNVGIRWALSRLRARYIGIFNNDSVLERTVLETAVRDLEADPSVGIVGGKIYYYHDPRRIWFGGGHVSWLRAGGVYEARDASDGPAPNKHSAKRRVTFLSGAFWIVRSKIFEDCGFLPEEYFVGGEETEFCLRVRRRGWHLLYDPDLVMWHKVGRSHDLSSGTPSNEQRVASGDPSYAYRKPRHLYNWYRYRLLFLRRNAPRLWYWAAYGLFAAYSLILPIMRPPTTWHIPKRIHKLALREALRDHRRYRSIRLEHLTAFESRVRATG